MINYFSLFKRSGYLIYLLVLGISVGMVYGSLVEAPGLLINVMKLDENWFLVIAGGIVFAFMLGSWLCTMLCSVMHENWILALGLMITLLGSILMWILMALEYVNIWAFLFPMIIVFIGIAFEIPIATARALAPFNRNAGSAAAMMGFFQMGMASLITAVVTFIELGRVFTMPICFAGLSTIGLVIILGYIFFLERPLKKVARIG